ncbi:hypothetical protein [Brevundimonas diminuta]|uniref:hypothetical protein n=1 Tax=Brevundimonas diminuta TaxID=293 RepID=UPI0025A5B158|nr:hypothetical protein [Brevundimonas diminuta]MDM8352229.1 hypothetical protein [Brevundimonas diminuta]
MADRPDHHTAFMDALHSDLMRQFPGSITEEDGNSFIIIETARPFLTVDVSSLAEAILGQSAMLSAAPAPEGRPVSFDREGLIALIMEETTDDIVADGWNRLGKPNVLVQGCRYIRRNAPPSPEGYSDPEAAAKRFAGFIADRLLATLQAEQKGGA